MCDRDPDRLRYESCRIAHDDECGAGARECGVHPIACERADKIVRGGVGMEDTHGAENDNLELEALHVVDVVHIHSRQTSRAQFVADGPRLLCVGADHADIARVLAQHALQQSLHDFRNCEDFLMVRRHIVHEVFLPILHRTVEHSLEGFALKDVRPLFLRRDQFVPIEMRQRVDNVWVAAKHFGKESSTPLSLRVSVHVEMGQAAKQRAHEQPIGKFVQRPHLPVVAHKAEFCL